MTRLITLFLLALLARSAWAEAPLRFGVLAYRPKVQAIAQWQPLATYLAAALDRRVELRVYDAAELEVAVAHDVVDVLLTTPGQYILLQQRYGLSAPLVTQITQEGPVALASFGGVLFTRTDAQAINALSDVVGKRIAAVNANNYALGGYQMQAFELLNAGVSLPEKDQLIATGMPQDRVVDAVLANRADVGFVRSGVLEALAREGKLDLGLIKVINRQTLPSFPYMTSTRLYPEWPVAVMAKGDEHLARQISIALLSLPSNSTIARAAGIHGFTIAADYSDVENVLRRLRIPPFDGGPDITVVDLWHRYAIWITALLGLLVAVLASGSVALLVQIRRVRQDIIDLQAAKEAISTSELFGKATFDAVSAHLCVLDPTGKILAVNQAWRDFLDENQSEAGHGNYGVGTNYLNICESSVGLQANEADPMAVGLRRVLSGACDEFVMEYPCHSPTQQRWFNAKVTRFPGGSGNVVVAHETITAVKLAEQREQHNNRVLQMLTEKAPLTRVLDVIALDMESMLPSSQCRLLLAGHEAEQATAQCASGWSHPIVSSLGKVLGALEVFQLNARPPATADLRLMEDKARLAAMAIEKTEAETRLQLAASVFTNAREGIVITDARGTIAEVNDTFTLITGYSRSEVLGKNPRMLNSGRHAPEFFKAMWSALNGKGHWYGEVWNLHKDGTEYAELLTISAVPDADGKSTGYVGLFTDITAIKEHAQQLEHIAHYDALTGLPNRVLLADRLKQAKVLSQRQKRALAVVVLDLDGFKTVNDAHGHNAGDELLIVLAQRMKAALRDGDTLARTGGDEFVAVLVDLEQAQDCEPVLMRLLQAAAAPATIGEAVLRVSASMGVTLYPQDGVEADVLLRHADQAMYLAKQAGKNRYHRFDVAQDAAANTQRESLERIRHALDEHEFVLYYQPKVNMKTGTVIGAEALIRWQHPERGLLAPADFLPVIETDPISVELGEWVIDTALAQMTEWHGQGLVLGVSVNIGARQLQQGNFAERLSGLLAAHPAVEPRYLELEVLETSALEDMAQVSAVMYACSSLGVHFALDDFGTGYSSLTYLKRLPAEMLKIDQSFVRGMLDDPDDLAIVEGVIGLVAAFRRQVIAEGVETVAHGELLLSLGCELAQGYGIARPMPAQAFPGWVGTWRPDASWEVWRGRTPTRDSQVLVFAEVEHRHWLRSIEIFLAGDQEAPPRLEVSNCHFGRWQETEGRARFGQRTEFAALAALHDRVHALGRELIESHARGQQEQVQRQLNEIRTLRDQLIAMLRQLVHQTG